MRFIDGEGVYDLGTAADDNLDNRDTGRINLGLNSTLSIHKKNHGSQASFSGSSGLNHLVSDWPLQASN